MSERGAVSGLVDPAAERGFPARSDAPAPIVSAGRSATLALTAWLADASLAGRWLPLARFFHGTAAVHLFAPLHQCPHRTALRARRRNDAVPRFRELAIVLSPSAFRLKHRAHQAQTNDEQDDPALIAPPSSRGGELASLAAVLDGMGLSETSSTTPAPASTPPDAGA